jgi:hypothetical protein
VPLARALTLVPVATHADPAGAALPLGDAIAQYACAWLSGCVLRVGGCVPLPLSGRDVWFALARAELATEGALADRGTTVRVGSTTAVNLRAAAEAAPAPKQAAAVSPFFSFYYPTTTLNAQCYLRDAKKIKYLLNEV